MSCNGQHEHLSCQFTSACTEDALRAGTEGLSYFGKDAFMYLFIFVFAKCFLTTSDWRELKNKQTRSIA